MMDIWILKKWRDLAWSNHGLKLVESMAPFMARNGCRKLSLASDQQSNTKPCVLAREVKWWICNRPKHNAVPVISHIYM
jgi:hypothetical protein